VTVWFSTPTAHPYFSQVLQEILRRCDLAQKSGIMTGALTPSARNFEELLQK
jgi:hypothetical protein